MSRSVREILDNIFLAEDEQFNYEHIRPRIDKAVPQIISAIKEKMPKKKDGKYIYHDGCDAMGCSGCKNEAHNEIIDTIATALSEDL